MTVISVARDEVEFADDVEDFLVDEEGDTELWEIKTVDT